MGERRPTGTPEEQQHAREQHEREQQERIAQQRGTDMMTTSEGPRPAQPPGHSEQQQPPQPPESPPTPTQHTELGHPGHSRNAEPLQRIRSALATARQASRTIDGGTVTLAGILGQIASLEHTLNDYLAEQEPVPGVQPAPQTQGELYNQVTNSRGETAEAAAATAAREPKAAVEADLHEVKESNKQGT